MTKLVAGSLGPPGKCGLLAVEDTSNSACGIRCAALNTGLVKTWWEGVCGHEGGGVGVLFEVQADKARGGDTEADEGVPVPLGVISPISIISSS